MIALIVAYAKNRVIGRDGRIPWNIPGEQRRFRELTTWNVVVMGRRTFEEIGRPLPNRITIVVSGTKIFDGENCYTARSLDDAVALAKDKFPEKDIFISGGARLYEEALHRAESGDKDFSPFRMYITEIETEPRGDTYFPPFDEDKYKKEIVERTEGDIPYTYVTYTLVDSKIYVKKSI